jgi:hypothetical protein
MNGQIKRANFNRYWILWVIHRFKKVHFGWHIRCWIKFYLNRKCQKKIPKTFFFLKNRYQNRTGSKINQMLTVPLCFQPIPSIHPSAHLSVSVSVCLLACLTDFLLCLSVCLFVCLTDFQHDLLTAFCLSVRLTLWSLVCLYAYCLSHWLTSWLTDRQKERQTVRVLSV